MPPKSKPKPEKMIRSQSRQMNDVTKISLIPSANKTGSEEFIADDPIDRNQTKSQEEMETYMGVNQILVYTFKNQPVTFFVPAYLRMRIKRVTQINYLESKAQIQAEIRIWLMIKEFPQVVQDQIINQTKIQINGSTIVELDQIRQPLKLDQSQIRNKSKNAVGFLFSQAMQLNIQSNAFWSPFQLVKLYANLEINKIVLGTGNQEYKKNLRKQVKQSDYQKYSQASVEFNFLDAHPFLQFSFGQVRQLGNFDIAESLVDMKFSNDTIKDETDQAVEEQDEQAEGQPLNLISKALGLKDKVKKQKLLAGEISPDAYEHGQIVIPLYKYPSTTIINVFLPLYMVAVMSLGVFFETNDMSNRDGSLATFLLAYIAFLPSIRESLPATPKIVFTQILVYMQITTSLICFFYSLVVNKQDGYQFQWDSDPSFLVCVALTALNMVIVVGMFLIHKLVWERQYNKLPKGSKKYINCKTLNTDDNIEWFNAECDQEFKDGIQIGLVKPFSEKKQKKKKVAQLFAGLVSSSNQMVGLSSAKKVDNEDNKREKIYPQDV